MQNHTIGSSIQTGARTSNVLVCRRDKLMSLVAWSGNLVAAHALAGNAILRSIVRELIIHLDGRFIVWVEGACLRPARLIATTLLTSQKVLVLDMILFSDERKGSSEGHGAQKSYGDLHFVVCSNQSSEDGERSCLRLRARARFRISMSTFGSVLTTPFIRHQSLISLPEFYNQGHASVDICLDRWRVSSIVKGAVPRYVLGHGVQVGFQSLP